MQGSRRADAIRAIGYKGDYPQDAAYKLLQRTEIRAALAERESMWMEACDVSKAMIVNELAAVAMFDPRKLVDEYGAHRPLHTLDRETAASIQSVEIEELYAGKGEERVHVGQMAKVKVGGKIEALKQLSSIYGLTSDENKPAGVPIGPGLTVIVQSGVVVQQVAPAGPAPPAVQVGETYEHLGLPPPEQKP